MSYTIKWDPKAKKSLKKLDLKVSQIIIEKINSIVENPKRFLEDLKEVGAYKLRVGNYRAIIDLKENEKVLEVLLVDHRGVIYKQLKRVIKFFKK